MSSTDATSFLDDYLRYTDETESPKIYHRWCALTAIGALLGRNVYLQFGHSRIYPNLYTMLIGDPGARKSTAIKLAKKLLTLSGYETFAAQKTRQEKFLLDLSGAPDEPQPGSKVKFSIDQTAENLWGDDASLKEPREVLIAADEFNQFIGIGNLDFCSLLGDLWDWDDEVLPYKHRLKNSKDVHIWQPTVSILGGNTPENFATAFPPAILGQGFLSRLLLIHGERRGVKYAFPPEPDSAKTEGLVSSLRRIRTSNQRGPISLDDAARRILGCIYEGEQDIGDVRFKSYANRRYTQLLKLCIIIACADNTGNITESTVIHANTILCAAEAVMPIALGEFGKSKNSDIAQKIIDVLSIARKPQRMLDLLKHVHKDIDRPAQLQEIMNNLAMAGRVQNVNNSGYLLKKEVARKVEFVDWQLLTEEERVGR